MKIIFYTKNFDEEIKEKVDVILSPEFYWTSKIDLDIKNLKEAKKIAKNMFNLDKDKYIFDAIKLDNKFFAIAIKKDLDLKIDKKYINSIRLAQVELYKYDALKIKNKTLKKVDDILFYFPETNENLKNIEEAIKEIKLSKFKISFDFISLDRSTIFYIFFSLIIINLFFFIQGFFYKKELNKLQQKKEYLSKTYNLPLTTYQLNSIYSSLKNQHKEIKKIKKTLELFSKTRLKFEKIEFDSKFYNIVINSNKNLDNYFKKFTIISSKVENKKYIAKLKYE